jgi:flavin-dependent dehydrogenase
VSAERVDVVIVGGGPAGASCAVRLGRAGLRVVLLEKKRFPRFKPCGEFMSPECLPILAELGVDPGLRGLGARQVGGMDLHGYGHTSRGTFVDVGRARAPFAYGWAVRRERFDAVLLDAARAQAGVEVREQAEVGDLLRAADGSVCGVHVREAGRVRELHARLVIGADGLRSKVARALGVQRSVPWLDKLALTTRYAGVPAKECAEVHFFPGGYFAATTVDDGQFSLNLVIDRAAVHDRVGDWDAFLANYLDRVPRLRDRLPGAERVEPVRGCGPLAMRTTAQFAAGVALVGDACGYVDPVTGEGIFFALRGAQLLAPAAVAALADPRPDWRALRAYGRGRRAEFVPRMAMAKLLQRGLRHPWLAERVLALLAARPRLTDLLVAVTGDYVGARELLRPSVWWRALRRPTARFAP